MPLSLYLAPPRGHSLPRLLLITALVLLVHACLLQQGPRVLWPRDETAAAPASRHLSAELAKPLPAPAVAPAPAPAPAHPTPSATAPRSALAAPAPKPVVTHRTQAAAPHPLAAPAQVPPATAAPVANTQAVMAVAPAPVPREPAADAVALDASGPPPAGKGATPTPLRAGSEAPPTRPPKFPPPARLLYDGRGEDHGLGYSAGGELLWLPDGTQYSAKLEITFLLARLRTWTSKGALAESGLQPLRFGDKPRGAELATHFQRDKGIISFSANNPDVPLQSGAQDKLSSLLQLSALVAAEPARYGAGSSIRFQAADAHRAELWDFRVSAQDTLELPGGNLAAIKLSKEPTVEFDQRIEVWLAPAQSYLPVRLRITEGNGAVVDLLWRKTLKPDATP